MEFDFIIVGGGSAGAIVARRLADARIGSVLLLEAGPKDEGVPSMMDISRLFELDSATDWGFLATPIRSTDRRLTYSRAKMLGGCGNHNDCAYLEPPSSDFDEWVELDAVGWAGIDVAPHFRRLAEKLSIEVRPPAHELSAAFLRAGVELGLNQVAFDEGVRPGVGMLPLNARGRFRRSSSVAYLHPLSSLPPNLQVLTETMVLKVLFEDGEACACVTSRGTIRARKEIILAAGSIQTPQLLMVSGIGDAAHLRGLGIDPIANVPAVGRNLVDHYTAAIVFETRESVKQWAITPYEAIAMLKIDQEASTPDSQCQFGLTVGGKNGRHGDDYQAPGSKILNLVDFEPNIARPRSRGEVRILSSDINVPPEIDLNYLSDPEGYDQRILIEAVKFSRRFASTSAMKQILLREVRPGPEVSSDDALVEYLKANCETYYHAAGTCRIGSAADPKSVVTPDLRVKGVRRLRVCDASIFPTMVSVNINATVMMVAEAGAHMIINSAHG